MYARRRGLPGVVMVGVGAAFDFHAGRVPQAPPWMQRARPRPSPPSPARRRRSWRPRATSTWDACVGVDLERGLRRRRREPADGAQPDAPALAVRGGEAGRPRPRRGDARSLRALRLLGNHLQPRVAAQAGALPAAQGHARRRRDQARARARAGPRRPGRSARLVACRGRSACGVAGAAGRRARRLRHRVGVGRTVRDLVAAAFTAVDLDWEPHVRVDPAFVRAPEPVPLVGDPARARHGSGGCRSARSRISSPRWCRPTSRRCAARLPRSQWTTPS